MSKQKVLFLFSICLCKLSFGSPIQDRKIDPAALSCLTSALGISQDADIVAQTQKQWLRKANQERWEVSELSQDQRIFVLGWAREQGVFSSWKPFCKMYDKALILGATTSRMQMRLDYLKQLWNEGTCFNEIVWLTGNRPLDKRVDGLLERCRTESEAAHILWDETDLRDEMRFLPVVFILWRARKPQRSSVLRMNGSRFSLESQYIFL